MNQKRTPHLKKRLLAGLLCLALLLTPLPLNALAAEGEPVSLTGNASVVSYTIADPANYYNNNAAIGWIEDIETASYDRLLDGQTADQYPERFAGNWVSSAWNDPNGGRSLFLNLYRGVSRDFTVDLGATYHVTDLRLHVGVSPTYGVPGPTDVTYYLSEDGVRFYKVGAVTSDSVVTQSAGIADLEHGSYDLNGLNFNARYVRVQLPVSVWVFLDELYVDGYTAPSETPDDLTKNELLLTEISKESYATLEQSGGIRNDFLAYAGWGMVNGTLQETYKTVRELEAAVAYLDTDGVPLDFLYDSVTFLAHANTQENGVYLGTGSNTDYAGKAEWGQWLDHILNYRAEGAVTNLDALEQAVANVKADMRPSELNGLTAQQIADYALPVRLSVYPAIHLQSNWGSLDAGDTYIRVTAGQDGALSYEKQTLTASKALDFTLAGHNGDTAATLSDRASAFYWYMRKAVADFNAKNYKNIYLSGFYYYEEKSDISTDALVDDTIRLYNLLVDDLNDTDYTSYWIPYYTVEGSKRWEELGFDYAIMQPNAYGYGQTRLNAAAEYARFYGLGIEMEWMGTATPGYADTFLQYLTSGTALGYQGTPQAWYWGTWDLARLCYNEGTCAGYRYVYDNVYSYISGHAVYSDNLLASATLSLRARQIANQENFGALDLSLLTDGIGNDGAAWGNGTIVQINANTSGSSPYELIAKLAETASITRLSLEFWDWTSAGVAPPSAVYYYYSADGERYQQLGKVTAEEDYTLSIPDGIAADYIMARIICAYNTATTPAAPYAWLGITEFTAQGRPTATASSVPTLDAGKNLAGRGAAVYTLVDSQGTAVASVNGNELKATLTDGTVAGAWNSGYYCWYSADLADPFTLQAELGELCNVDAVSLSFYEWISAGVGIPGEVSFYTSTDGSDWAYLATCRQPQRLLNASGATEPDNAIFSARADQAAPARYVKAVFARDTNIYTQGGRNTWIALGELEIEGNAVNSGTQEPLTENLIAMSGDMLTVAMVGTPNTAGETGLEAVEANKYILVDGLYGDSYPWSMNNAATSAYIGFQQGWEGSYDESAFNKGWGNSGYYVEVNLGQPYTLRGMSMDFLRNNPSGIGAPDSVVCLTSRDGKTWETQGALTEPVVTLCENNNTHEKLNYVLRMEDVTAQYVRFAFKRSLKDENNVYAFICFDEVVLSGTASHIHNWSEWTVSAAPTCDESGSETRACAACGEVQTREIAALGHDYLTVVTVPTCVEGGYTTYTCSRCGYAYTADEVPATGHHFVDTVFAPTPGEAGYTIHICSDCGYEYWDAFVETPVDPCASFTDIDTSGWYHAAVDYAISRGYMNGTGATTFEPNSVTTRAQLVTVLYRAAGEPEVSGGRVFTDVSEGAYYHDAVAWANQIGIVKGTGESTFAPNKPATREQLATVLHRYAAYLGLDVSGRAPLDQFTDAGKISSYARDAMAWAVDAKLLTGHNTGELGPAGSATRAQLATILPRWDALLLNQ